VIIGDCFEIIVIVEIVEIIVYLIEVMVIIKIVIYFVMGYEDKKIRKYL
jgi:hypothetical protein